MSGIYDQSTISELIDGISREPSLKQALAAFEKIYMASRNLAERTRVEYSKDLTQLIDFLSEQGITQADRVGLSNLQAFLAYLDRRGLTGVSRRRKAASIKAFFGFLKSSDLISNNPARELIPPEQEYKEPRFLTTQEYQALVRTCSHHPRDAALVELILQTGLRLSEVARITIYDFELPTRINRDPGNTGSITIRGKGRKQRTLPLNYKVCRAIKAYLAVRPEIDEPALFLNRFLEPMGQRAIQRVVEKYLAEAGIRNASVHTLRHTFATHHVAKGTNLRTVQEALGHADLRTTSIYVSTAKEAMRRELQWNAL